MTEPDFVVEPPPVEENAEPVYIPCMGKDFHKCNKKYLLKGCPIPDLCYAELSGKLDMTRTRRFIFLHNKEVGGDGFSSVEVPKIYMWAIYVDVK